MSLMEIAVRTGVPLMDIEDLVSGAVTEGIAARLGVPLLALQEFVMHGQASAKLAHRLGMSMASAEELARSLVREGAIGLVLGLLLAARGAGRKDAVAGV